MAQATLSSPDGEFKTIVDVGSNDASVLQGIGWGIYDESRNTIPGIEEVSIAEVRKDLQIVEEEQENIVTPGRPELTNAEADKATDAVTQANGYTEEEYKRLIQSIKDEGNLDEMGMMVLDGMEYADFGKKQYTGRELTQLIDNSIADAEQSLTPYYNELKDKDMADLKSGFEKIRTDAAGYKAQEAMDYKSALKSTQKSLADRGLTFSGIARQELGAKSALGGGKDNIKGRLNEQRDLNYETKMESFKERGQNLGRAGEKYFGTNTMEGLDTSIPDRESTYGGYKSVSNIKDTSGAFLQDRTKNIANRASDIFGKKPTTSTPTDWSTAYEGRFSHLKNNPNRAQQLADEYDKTDKPTGGWRGSK